jgi:thiol-disulfide isomerase/thioredoxin
MKLDPKYFNLFIGICALLTVMVIVYGTINYTQKQATEFRDTIAAVQTDTLSFAGYADTDSLNLRDLQGDPVVIQFWSTWSGRSFAVNDFLDSYQNEQPSLRVIAAVVRDGEEQVLDYINEHNYRFHYVNGTPFFQELLVPGVPSQILIDRNGNLFDTQVGDDLEALREKLDRLMNRSDE